MTAYVYIGDNKHVFPTIGRARDAARSALKILALDPEIAPKVPQWLETLDDYGWVDTGKVVVKVEHKVHFSYLEPKFLSQTGGTMNTHAKVGDVIDTPLGRAVVYQVAE